MARKLGAEIQPLADRIMTLVLQLITIAGKQSTVLEDAFLVMGSMASGTFPLFLWQGKVLIPFSSIGARFPPILERFCSISEPCIAVLRGSSALLRRSWSHRRYLPCSRRRGCSLLQHLHDCTPREFAEPCARSSSQDYYCVLLWRYCHVHRPQF